MAKPQSGANQSYRPYGTGLFLYLSQALKCLATIS
jgi:hypothetical protein